jgi:hypothetical protein
MNKSFEEFEKQIKKKHSFRFTPKYMETFKTTLKPRLFVEIAIKTFEALEWDLVYQEDNRVEAKRKNGFGSWAEKISAVINHKGEVEVKSISLGNGMWDKGRNSKRVKLFIFAFKAILSTFDHQKLSELEDELKKKDNWDNYVIPDKLPAPKKFREPQILIPALGLLGVALLLAYILALLSVNGVYVIGLFEVGVGIVLGFALKYLIKLGNYTDWSKLKFVLAASIILTYLLNQYFQYHLIRLDNNYEAIGFLEFIKVRLEQGLLIKSMNTGAIGFVISWCVQLVLTYLVAYFRTVMAIVKYTIERVPEEVAEFALYHFVKGKNKIAIQQELSKMGWQSQLEQDAVFEAIGGMQGGQELERME